MPLTVPERAHVQGQLPDDPCRVDLPSGYVIFLSRHSGATHGQLTRQGHRPREKEGRLQVVSIGGQRGAAISHAQRQTGQAEAVVTMIASERPLPDVAQRLMAVHGPSDSLLVRQIAPELGARARKPGARDDVDGLLHTALRRNTHRGPHSGSPGESPLARRAAIPALEGSSSQ